MRNASLLGGLLIISVAIALTVRAHLGLSPWDVLHQGLSRHLPISIGEASVIVGLVVLIGGWRLGMRPGWGTICNMALIGVGLDRVLDTGWIPDEASGPLWLRSLMLGASLVLFGIGSGAYIAPRLGSGPRDSLMLAIVRRGRWPVARVRIGIEGSACAVGLALGGSVGVGTVATALLVGPSVQLGLRLFRYRVHGEPSPSTTSPGRIACARPERCQSPVPASL